MTSYKNLRIQEIKIIEFFGSTQNSIVITTNKVPFSLLANNYSSPACVRDHRSWYGCQTPDVSDTACHRVRSKSWLWGLPVLWQLPFLYQHNPVRNHKIKTKNELGRILSECYKKVVLPEERLNKNTHLDTQRQWNHKTTHKKKSPRIRSRADWKATQKVEDSVLQRAKRYFHLYTK